MATGTSSAPSPRSRIGTRRVLVALTTSAVLIFALISGVFYWIARTALPQVEGSLPVDGLPNPVTVIRDRYGVPNISAGNLADLFFAQGYVTAQDRLWQMDVLRRVAAGELSEIFGQRTVEFDREQRILRLRMAARKQREIASPEDRANFDAYARGVNAFIDAHRDRLPLEFRLLRYAPKAWTPEDSSLIAMQMVKDLNYDPHQLVHQQILEKLGPELTADLYVNSSWHDRPPTAARPSFETQSNDPEYDEEEDSKPSSITTLFHFITEPLHGAIVTAIASNTLDMHVALGSNNWVVSGAHTTTRKPLLSNDMHLGHQMPNLWYEVHLESGIFNVAGVSLPGLPYVVVGHNQRVAWGFTNLGPTVADLYQETFNDAGQYRTPEGWRQPEHRREVIHVKGKPDVVEDVVITRHGPIINAVLAPDRRRVALRWTIYDGIRNPFFKVDAAQNWQEFRAAFSEFDAPGQNVVYADVDGNIGYQATGKIPIRATEDGRLLQDGSDSAHEWTSYIPYEKMPSVFNPPSGIVGTANARIAPDGYPYSISSQWEAPWRTDRIYRVLQSGKKFSAGDMLGLQNDIYSEWDRFCADHFVYAIDHAAGASDRVRAAADILRNWDGRMSAQSAAPVIESRARKELMRLLLEPKLGAGSGSDIGNKSTLSWESYDWGMQSVWLENILVHQPRRWLPANYENLDAVLTAAMEATVNAPDAPKDLNSWTWGRVNAVEIQHPILGAVPILNHWTGPGTHVQSGSGYTVKAVTRHHGPSERLTVDLADLDHSTLNLVTGESGNFLSQNYMDQWSEWYVGTTQVLPFSDNAVQKAGIHKLLLTPGK